MRSRILINAFHEHELSDVHSFYFSSDLLIHPSIDAFSAMVTLKSLDILCSSCHEQCAWMTIGPSKHADRLSWDVVERS